MKAIEELKATINNASKSFFNQNQRYDEEDVLPQSQQTIDRIIKLKKILMFFEKYLKKKNNCFFSRRRQKFVRLSKAIDTGLIYSLKSIINEFSFAQAESPFKQCFKTIFTQRRKLGVIRKKEKKYAHSDIQEITININIIKGRNIPIRETSLSAIRTIANKKKDLNYKMAFGGGYSNSGFSGGGGFGNSNFGAFNPGFTQNNFNNTGGSMNANPVPPMSRFMRDENIRMITTAAQNSIFIFLK